MNRVAQRRKPSQARALDSGSTKRAANIDADFCEWLNSQASALRSNRPKFLDWENLAEELEATSKKDHRELRSHLKVLLAHLLKWRYQPQAIGRRGRSWKQSIRLARDGLADILADSPSLKSKLNPTIKEAYRRARIEAADETGLSIEKFPSECPWRFEQITADEFFPRN
jgi:hypothetical protein